MNPKPLRLVFTPEQSAVLRDSGIRFAIIHPDSLPAPAGRWVADLFEIDPGTAAAAYDIVTGKDRAMLHLSECDEAAAHAAGRLASGTHPPADGIKGPAARPPSPGEPAPAVLPRHPLDAPGVLKIALGPEASAALAAAGEHHFIIAAKADCTAPPTARGGFVLHCLPLDKDTAAAAANLALGRTRTAPRGIRPNQ